jgi:hypothetical protein
MNIGRMVVNGIIDIYGDNENLIKDNQFLKNVVGLKTEVGLKLLDIATQKEVFLAKYPIKEETFGSVVEKIIINNQEILLKRDLTIKDFVETRIDDNNEIIITLKNENLSKYGYELEIANIKYFAKVIDLDTVWKLIEIPREKFKEIIKNNEWKLKAVDFDKKDIF